MLESEEITAAAHTAAKLCTLAADPGSYAAYHDMLFAVHHDPDPATDVTRRWIAGCAYPVEERHIPALEEFRPAVLEDLAGLVVREIAAGTRLRHPMSAHMYDGAPSLDEIRFFIHHHWLRSCMFFRLVAEAALRLDSFEDWSALYCNLYDETGEGNPTRAHPVLLRRLMEYLDLPADAQAHSTLTSEQAYLNNRIRCVRHADPAWGLGVLYAIEVTTSSNHRSIYHMLRRAGIPDAACEFHRLHGEVDDGHSEQLWKLIERRADVPGFQATLVRAIRHSFALGRTYFDDLWKEMQARRDERHGHSGADSRTLLS